MTVDEFGQLLDRKLDEKLQPIRDDLESVKGDMESVKGGLGEVSSRLGKVENRLSNVEQNMVTKDDLQSNLTTISKILVSRTKEYDDRLDRLEQHAGLPPLS